MTICSRALLETLGEERCGQVLCLSQIPLQALFESGVVGLPADQFDKRRNQYDVDLLFGCIFLQNDFDFPAQEVREVICLPVAVAVSFQQTPQLAESLPWPEEELSSSQNGYCVYFY